MLYNIARHVGSVKNIKPLFQRWPTSRLIVSSRSNVSNDGGSESKFENDEPIRYSTSKAANWRAAYSRKVPSNRPFYEVPIGMTCLAVILLYFCVLREENDIDLMLANAFPDIFVDFQQNTSESEQQLDHNKKSE